MSSRQALAHSPPSVAALRRPHSRGLYLRPTRTSVPSRAVACGATAARDRLQPRLVAVQSPPPPPLAAGAVPRDAETGLAILLVVLAVVMTFSTSLIILSLSAYRATKKLELVVNKLAKTVAEEVPETLLSLKLSLLEIGDLTSQLQKLRLTKTVILAVDTKSLHSDVEGSTCHTWTSQTFEKDDGLMEQNREIPQIEGVEVSN